MPIVRRCSPFVDGIGRKLLRGVPTRGFDYQFKVIDQVEPNAFTLPGGYIFVSRGLLALTNTEDELACVIGHEITHAAHRHAAAQQAVGAGGNPLTMPWVRAAQLAAYSRDMERDADQGGQILCAAAGYDPTAMSAFLTALLQAERLRSGGSRSPSFYDLHPGTEERVATTRRSIRSTHLRVVKANQGEDIASLDRRTTNAWDLETTAVYNGIFAVHRFSGGELVKITREEPYVRKATARP